MTYCTTLAEPLLKKIQDKMTLDEIGKSLCGDSVKNPRQKAIRLIRELLGEETLVEYAETLGYDIEKAQLGKKPKKSLRKIETDADNESKKSLKKKQNLETISFNDEFDAIRKLITIFSLQVIKNVIAEIEKE